MLSIQAREYYKFVINQLSGFQSNINDLMAFANKIQHQEYELLIVILNNQGHNQEKTNVRSQAVDKYINRFNNGIASFKKSFNSLDVILEYKELERIIRGYIKKENIVSPEIEELFNSFEDFRVKVQTFLQDDIENAKMELCISINRICNDYNKIVSSYSWFIMNLEENTYDFDKSKYMLFDIKILGIEFDVAEFADKIHDISEMYAHLSEIYPFDEDYEIQPLKIVKIESGSLDFSVLGDAIIIEVVSGLILSAVINIIKYFKKYKKPMPEDEKNKLLEEKLNEISLKTGNIKHRNHIKKSAIDFTSRFFTIKINNETYSYEGDDIVAVLPFLEKKLLNEKNDEGISD